ncbi:MAG: hypothetical protein HZA02_04300 [Nitrospinae bacterium]|nr:hypothetical protein [Nitrospinota bacterium]
MDLINKLSDYFSNAEFNVPVSQVMTLVVINSLCLFLGKNKLGLLVSYCFVVYWGFVFNRSNFVGALGQTAFGLYVYVFFGISTALIAVAGFLRQE